MGQLIVLFIFLVGRVATLHSGEKVRHIYKKEQHIMSGKLSLRNAMDDFMDQAANVRRFDESDMKRLRDIHEAMRFITPSGNSEARKFDDQFILTLDKLANMMRNVSLNKAKISEKIDLLERILSKRKKY